MTITIPTTKVDAVMYRTLFIFPAGTLIIKNIEITRPIIKVKKPYPSASNNPSKLLVSVVLFVNAGISRPKSNDVIESVTAIKTF